VITPGPNDGNVWFVESAAGKVARITPLGVVSEFDTSASTDQGGVTFGSDGNVWFTETSANQIGRLTPGVLVVPAAPRVQNPVGGGFPAAVGWICNPSPLADGLQIGPTAIQQRSLEPGPAAGSSVDLARYFEALAQADESLATFLGGDDPFAVGGPAKSRKHR
jgi:hypothetical protein